MVGHCFGGFVARAMALAAPGLTQSLTMLSCGPSLRPAYARAVVAGIDDLLGRGGAMLDRTREQVPSLSFGAGPHYCLGAYLTGMQGEILFPRLLDRFPRLRPAGDLAYRTPGSTLRGLDRLPLRLD